GVAALEPHLVRPHAILRFDHEARVERHPTFRVGVQLDHPAANPVRIELRVPGRVQRVGEVHAVAVATHLDHLWPAVERAVGCAWVRGAPHDAADARRAREHRPEGITYVVLPELTGAKA